ncbi:MAG: 1-deoxy-D-xylulose-5-phosphate reductoisomerase [Hyphomonadaceae bacterium]
MKGLSRRISILGATGSVGASTALLIEEVRAGGAEIEIEAITGGRNLATLIDLARRLRPRFVALADESQLVAARAALPGVAVGAGPSALVEAAARDADWVMSAIVGAAGLAPTLAAVERGAAIALANKECLVCAGPLMRAAAAKSGARLLPVDSEHNAVFQVLSTPDRVERVTLTASGGPFRTWTREAMARASPAEAGRHPTWSMGPKITIDSATLMNKGLELIEASYLFDISPEKLSVLVHPQSVVHSLVHYVDGSVLAQMAAPDMRVPIASALAWPDRVPVSTARLDLARIGALSFEEPDENRFPALALARAALTTGAAATNALNAANEIAVEAFLRGRIGFLDIPHLVEASLEALAALGLIANSPSSFDDVRAIDEAARAAAGRELNRLAAA